MPDINGILNIGKSALMTHQKGMSVIGNNISNVNTPGYSRQRVNLNTNEPLSYLHGQFGTGVNVSEVQRVYDRYLDEHINTENQSLGRWEAQKGALDGLEMLFSGNEFSQAINEFWNSWEDLANDPMGQAERKTLVSRAQQVANDIQKIYTDLRDVQAGGELDQNILGSVDNINQITARIADLNKKIFNVESTGQNANDYRDHRELLIRQLSELINIKTYENDNGKVRVMLNDGKSLVEDNRSWSLSTIKNAKNLHDIMWTDDGGVSTKINSDITGGKLKGWLEVRDGIIQDNLDKMDTFAANLINRVNSIHQNGYGLDGSTGNDFFNGTSASDIAVNEDLINEQDLIAVSSTAAGVPGDNGNAIAIAALRTEPSIDEYYDSIVMDVGNAVAYANRQTDYQSDIISSLNAMRETVSGVSLDEEMINLIKFQHAYEASAKLISSADELMQTVINMI